MTGAHQSRRMDQEGQRFVGGAEAGGQQMEVDVQKGHRGGSTHPMQDGFGAHEHRRTGRLRRARRRPRLRRRRLCSSAATSSRRRVTPARSVFMRRSTARRADQGAFLLATRAVQQLAPTWRTAAPQLRALRQLPAARQASRRARPVRSYTHTRGPRRAINSGSSSTDRASRTNSSENRPLRGSAPRRSTQLDRGPSRPFSAATGAPRPSGRHSAPRAGRRDQEAAAAVPARPFGDHINRAVGGRALFAVGLVVGIEHDCGGQARERGPGAGTGSPPRWASPPWPRPNRSWPRSHAGPSRSTRRSAQPTEGTSTRTVPSLVQRVGVVDHREHRVDEIGGRGEPEERRPGVRAGPAPSTR